MKSSADVLKGHYTFERGKFIPHGDMERINSKLKQMKMLAGSTETGKGEFYVDTADGLYWHYIQFEDYRTELRCVSREFIESNFPSVDCEKELDIGR